LVSRYPGCFFQRSPFCIAIHLGREIVNSHKKIARLKGVDLNGHNGSVLDGAKSIPRWDAQRRELTIAGHVVKRFRLPAPNQESILTAFEEEGWPLRILDPLPPKFEMDCKRRLHETIKTLNRHHMVKIIRFCGDGTGQGVLWEWTEDRD
jgi:hypothetical protein